MILRQSHQPKNCDMTEPTILCPKCTTEIWLKSIQNLLLNPLTPRVVEIINATQ